MVSVGVVAGSGVTCSTVSLMGGSPGGGASFGSAFSSRLVKMVDSCCNVSCSFGGSVCQSSSFWELVTAFLRSLRAAVRRSECVAIGMLKDSGNQVSVCAMRSDRVALI